MIIYKTTNLIDGKIYVGYDTKNDSNYYGSGVKYLRAEKKHGKENFRKAVIDSSDDFDELCRKEIFWINFYDARNPVIGYNILEGGQGHKGRHSSETKLKISRGRQGVIASKETKQILSLSHIGIKQSADTIRKRIEKIKGMKRTLKTRLKMSVSHKGKPSNAKGKSSSLRGKTWIVENGKRLWKEVELR